MYKKQYNQLKLYENNEIKDKDSLIQHLSQENTSYITRIESLINEISHSKAKLSIYQSDQQLSYKKKQILSMKFKKLKLQMKQLKDIYQQHLNDKDQSIDILNNLLQQQKKLLFVEQDQQQQDQQDEQDQNYEQEDQNYEEEEDQEED